MWFDALEFRAIGEINPAMPEFMTISSWRKIKKNWEGKSYNAQQAAGAAVGFTAIKNRDTNPKDGILNTCIEAIAKNCRRRNDIQKIKIIRKVFIKQITDVCPVKRKQVYFGQVKIHYMRAEPYVRSKVLNDGFWNRFIYDVDEYVAP